MNWSNFPLQLLQTDWSRYALRWNEKDGSHLLSQDKISRSERWSLLPPPVCAKELRDPQLPPGGTVLSTTGREEVSAPSRSAIVLIQHGIGRETGENRPQSVSAFYSPQGTAE